MGEDFRWVNPDGIDINDPFKGLFRRTGKVFRYTLNHSKKSGYSMSDFKLFSNEGFLLSEHFDPLPILMGYGSTVTPGLWLGDIIGVGDTFPSDYKLMNELYVEW